MNRHTIQSVIDGTLARLADRCATEKAYSSLTLVRQAQRELREAIAEPDAVLRVTEEMETSNSYPDPPSIGQVTRRAAELRAAMGEELPKDLTGSERFVQIPECEP